MFWSGETLNEKSQSLFEPFDANQVDCAAYTLSVGSEIYVTPDDQTDDSTTVTIRRLNEGQAFTIPPGQFAYLITEEIVSVPSDALAFISIRAKIKFRGLVNVSGFHVDPGFRGQLTFAVFNAGPVPVHLKQGQRIFLIWYANLDQTTKYKKSGSLDKGLSSDTVTAISGEIKSFAGLAKKIEVVTKELDERIRSVEKWHARFNVIGIIGLGIGTLVLGNWLWDVFSPFLNPTEPSTQLQVLPIP